MRRINSTTDACKPDVAGKESIQEPQLKPPVLLHKVGACIIVKLCLTHTIWGFYKLTKTGSFLE